MFSTRKLKYIIGVILVILIGWFIFGTNNEGTKPDDSEEIADPNKPIPEVIETNKGPMILFPNSARTDNRDANHFVYRFIRVLAENDYKKYRLMVTDKRDPIPMETFEKAYLKVKTIKVIKMEKIESFKALREQGLEASGLPAYLLQASVELKDKTERQVDLIIFLENGKWVSSN
jgi:hypothetical protein